MRIFYDINGKKISRKEVRKLMEKSIATIGDASEIKTQKILVSNMREEDYAGKSGITYKDYEVKK